MNFSWLAPIYDRTNGADYDAYSAYVLSELSNSTIKIQYLLDMGCGTGEMTLRLARAGLDIVAVDASADMLSVLRNKIQTEQILLVCQDIRRLDLYGTVQAAVCVYDTLNYLQTPADLAMAFGSVRKFLEKDGLFLFDVNTLHAYQNFYANKEYHLDGLVWKNCFDAKTGRCLFDLQYKGQTATHTQQYFPAEAVESALKDAGFAIIKRGDAGFGKNKDVYTCQAL